jgi:hypothetical protein
MADNEQSEPEISTVIWVLVFIVCIIFDILSLIPGVGDIEDIPGAVVFVLNLALGAGGVPLTIQGIVMVGKAIPGLQELPLWTGGASVAFAAEKISALKPALKVTQEVGAVEGGEIGEMGEAGAAAEGVAAGTEEAGSVAAQTGEAGAAEAGKTAPSSGESSQEKPEKTPESEGENWGDAVGDLQQNLLEPAPEEESPPAPGPYQEDKEKDEEPIEGATASAGARKRIEADQN